MSLLLLSFAALAMGPLLLRFGGAARWLPAFLDGFVLVTLVGLVFAHVLPHSLELAGWLSLPLLAAGALLPGMVERVPAARTPALRTVAWGVILTGIAVHAFLDGTVLIEGPAEAGVERLLGVGVVLHRLPVGLAIWWLVRPSYGLRGVFFVCGILIVFSTLGLVAGAPFVAGLAGQSLGLFQAFVAGGLLHVALHSGGAPLPGTHRAAGGGALLGLVLLVVLTATHSGGHEHGGPNAEGAFLALALTSAPALALAVLLAVVARTLTGERRELASAGVFGRVRSTATAALGGATVLVSIALLGLRFTVLRVIVSLVLAVTFALLRPGDATATASFERASGFTSRLRIGLRRALVDDVDHNGAWILVGLGAAGLLHASLPPSGLVAIPSYVAVPLLALVGLPLYLSPLAMTPIVAVLLEAGLSPGAALVLLGTAPLLRGALAPSSLARSALVRSSAVVVVLAILLGLAVDGARAWAVTPFVTVTVTSTKTAVSPIETVCLVALTLLGLASMWRLGPRGFAAHVGRVHDREAHTTAPASAPALERLSVRSSAA